jgi:hypothetical protein
MQYDMLRFHPTVATTCFGMNDGRYMPMNAETAKFYRDGQTSIVQQLKRGGVRLIVVGSPGCVDSDTFKKDPNAALMYNKTLSEERDIAREVAQAEGVVFADVITPMIEVMTKAKAKYGKEYHLAGGDGVHPAENGHLVMAYAFLKALGCDGNLGEITVDLAAGKAEAKDGHTVVGYDKGTVEIESTRYPFCFYGEHLDSPNSTRGIIEFFPFNAELNRLTLKVVGVGAAGAKVTWGPATKQFSAEELMKGINLAEHFLDNPFSEPFRLVEAKIRLQQDYEVKLIHQMIHNFSEYQQVVPGEEENFEKIIASGIRRDKQMCTDARTTVVPVKHKITVEAGS